MTVPTLAAEAAEGAAASSAAQTASRGRKWGPGSRGATAGKPKAADELARRRERKPPQADPTAPAGEDPTTDEPSPGGEPDKGGFLAGFREGAAQGRSLPARGGAAVQTGSGVLVAFVAWVWIVLPYLDGGLPRVRDVLRAKLTNVGPNGQELP